MTAHAPAVTIASRAEHVQKIVTPGGIDGLARRRATPCRSSRWNSPFAAAPRRTRPSKPGVATLLAGLLDEGAGPYDARGFHRAVDDLAIHLGFGADRDAISGHLQTLSRNIDKAFELLKLALDDARLDARRRRARAQPARRRIEARRQRSGRAWRPRPFARRPFPTIPMAARCAAISRRSRRSSRADLDRAARAAVRARRISRSPSSAPSTRRRCRDRARRDLRRPAAAKRSDAGGADRRSPVSASARSSTLDVPQSTIRFGRPGITQARSRLFRRPWSPTTFSAAASSPRGCSARCARSAAWPIRSIRSSTNIDQCPMLIGATATKNERAGESLARDRGGVRRSRTRARPRTNSTRPRNILIGSYALRFDTSTKIASQLVHLQLDGFEPSYLDERNGRIAAVGLEDCKRAASRLLGDGGLLVTMVGKPEGV